MRPDLGLAPACAVPGASSSTGCELVAIALALRGEPEEILTDSLCALQLLRSCHRRSAAQILGCDVRILVRLVVGVARSSFMPPALEKVRAHDNDALGRGVPKAVVNEPGGFLGDAGRLWRCIGDMVCPAAALWRRGLVARRGWRPSPQCIDGIRSGLVAAVTSGVGISGEASAATGGSFSPGYVV